MSLSFCAGECLCLDGYMKDPVHKHLCIRSEWGPNQGWVLIITSKLLMTARGTMSCWSYVIEDNDVSDKTKLYGHQSVTDPAGKNSLKLTVHLQVISHKIHKCSDSVKSFYLAA